LRLADYQYTAVRSWRIAKSARKIPDLGIHRELLRSTDYSTIRAQGKSPLAPIAGRYNSRLPMACPAAQGVAESRVLLPFPGHPEPVLRK
jgi:hypothetical protein